MARRSLIAKARIPKGAVITRDMIVIKRPGTGLAPKMIYKVVGKKSKVDIKEDGIIDEGMIEW
jgi:sialic acid synthase SpsE